MRSACSNPADPSREHRQMEVAAPDGVATDARPGRELPVRPWLIGAGLSLVAYLVWAAVNHGAMWWMIDLQVYRSGADAARHGAALYVLHYTDSLPFTYPPIAALTFVPMAVVPLVLSKALIVAASLAALAWTCWITAGALGYERRA